MLFKILGGALGGVYKLAAMPFQKDADTLALERKKTLEGQYADDPEGLMELREYRRLQQHCLNIENKRNGAASPAVQP